MTEGRRRVLAAFVLDQQTESLRKARNWSFVGLLLCGVVAAILIGVKLDGASGSDDVMVPAVIAVGITLLLALMVAHTRSEIRGLRRGELVSSLLASPARIDHVEAITLFGPGGAYPALVFHVAHGSAHTIVMSETTRSEFMTWLPCRD